MNGKLKEEGIKLCCKSLFGSRLQSVFTRCFDKLSMTVWGGITTYAGVPHFLRSLSGVEGCRPIVVILLLALLSCSPKREESAPIPVAHSQSSAPVRGVTIADDFPDYSSDECLALCDSLHNGGVDYVAVTPCGYIPTTNSTKIKQTFWSRRDYAASMQKIRARGMRVMLKPYLWSDEFYTMKTWTGNITQPDAGKRREWFESYTAFMLDNARFAREGGAELLCIGLELPLLTPYEQEWRKLIDTIRKVYSGKLIYAAHGIDEARAIRFWDALDCVGINIYPTLSDSLNPTDAQLKAGWQPIKKELAEFSSRVGKKIIFTEAGFRSVVGAAWKPYEWPEHSSRPVNMMQQVQAYRILAEECYHEPWFCGIFWWKFFTNPHEENAGGFTPQNKPAYAQMLKDFKRMKE
jgi:hypothetical protein